MCAWSCTCVVHDVEFQFQQQKELCVIIASIEDLLSSVYYHNGSSLFCVRVTDRPFISIRTLSTICLRTNMETKREQVSFLKDLDKT